VIRCAVWRPQGAKKHLRAGATPTPVRRDHATKNTYSQRAHRERERELSEHAEIAYRRLVTDWKATAPNKDAAVT